MRFLTLFLIFIGVSLYAIHPDQAGPLSEPPRIVKLLEGSSIYLPIEPAIPLDFIAMKEQSYPGYLFWGRKHALEAFFENPRSLKEPIILISESPAKQVGMGFSAPLISQEEAIQHKKNNTPGFKHVITTWDTYPVEAGRFLAPILPIFAAQVGLNHPDGHALVFMMATPLNAPEKNIQQWQRAWDRFITETKVLDDQNLIIRAGGISIEKDYTQIEVAGRKAKFFAEARQRDGKIQVVFVTESPEIKFNFKPEQGKQSAVTMGQNLFKGQSIVKIDGQFIFYDGESKEVHSSEIFVPVDVVEEFSTNQAEADLRGWNFYAAEVKAQQ